MFKRLRATFMIAAGVASLSSACGDAEEKQSQPERPAQVATHQARESSALEVPRRAPEPVQMVDAGVPVEAPAVDVDAELDRLALEAKKSPQAKVAFARALVEAGKLREARKHIEDALDEAPESTQAWNLLGRIELSARDLDAAVVAFQRAAEEDPDNAYAWNNLGYALIEQEKFDEAAAALENATAGAKPTAYMWNNLGMAYEHMDRIREARAAYRQAAAAGSAKGKANAERLEGVHSLEPAAQPDAMLDHDVDEQDTSGEELGC
ncbi:MAG TPA: tetratricopeptide repeat protein [Kofleriaceae bacterium]|nr:tetratricopeptide repeat protein [Kofleriaceae bacterium]